MDQGCSIKLKKKEIVEHEKEKCKYRELMCPGCEEKIQARAIPDHFINCPELYFEIEDVKLGKTQTEQYNLDTSKGSFQPVVYKLESSENWFLLCPGVLEDELVLYIKHYSGEERKETFSYNLKVSNTGNTFSMSRSGVCTPFDMEIKDVRRKGFTLDISVEVMVTICFLPNLDNEKEYKGNIELSLFKSYP